ncbi:MAG TPA: hypothetical protein VGR56_05025, partial [Nitrososphaerales archaeon]|nr:hypothetical protein [Nitrososphaerales archaeon]
MALDATESVVVGVAVVALIGVFVYLLGRVFGLGMRAGRQQSTEGLSHSKQFVILALAAILPIGVLVVTSFEGDVVNLTNPCFTWGAASGSSITVSPGGPCSSAGATSQTIPQMLAMLAIIQGGILIGAAIGVL